MAAVPRERGESDDAIRLPASLDRCITPDYSVSMPNQPRDDNPPRAIRINDELWAKVKAAAEARGVKISVIAREALERFVAKH